MFFFDFGVKLHLIGSILYVLLFFTLVLLSFPEQRQWISDVIETIVSRTSTQENTSDSSGNGTLVIPEEIRKRL